MCSSVSGLAPRGDATVLPALQSGHRVLGGMCDIACSAISRLGVTAGDGSNLGWTVSSKVISGSSVGIFSVVGPLLSRSSPKGVPFLAHGGRGETGCPDCCILPSSLTFAVPSDISGLGFAVARFAVGADGLA